MKAFRGTATITIIGSCRNIFLEIKTAKAEKLDFSQSRLAIQRLYHADMQVMHILETFYLFIFQRESNI